MLSRRDSGRFNCFSPPIMIATFVIEIVLAIYTVARYKLDLLGRLVIAALLSLALFQLCEYHVCGGWGLRAEEWAQVGFVAITALPALGLHIQHVLAKRTGRRLVIAGYLTMAVCCLYFLTAKGAFDGYACTGNYVIFQIGNWQAAVYALYYYGWLATAIVLGMRWANHLKAAGATARERLQAIRGLIIGYLVFLVPTALANSVKPETRRGIPSIMCGFAVLFAFILTFYIMARLGRRRTGLDAAQ